MLGCVRGDKGKAVVGGTIEGLELRRRERRNSRLEDTERDMPWAGEKTINLSGGVSMHHVDVVPGPETSHIRLDVQ